MKKVMFGLAAAVAIGAFAIESANTVGYQQIPTPQGSSMRCATFRTVLTASYPLSEIKVEGSDGVGDVNAQTISSAGLWDGEYYYLTEDGWGVPTGWYKDAVGDEPADDVILPQGTALYITSANNDVTLLVSGEVAKGNVTVPFAQGSGQIGNCTPVDVDLNDVTVEGSDGVGDVNAQAISSDGVWDGEYYYLTEDGWGVTTGWYKDAVGDIPADDVTLAPGDSLFVTSANNDVTFVFPAVIAE